MRVLVIECERRPIELLRIALLPDGFQLQTCADSEEGIEFLRAYEYDAVIVGKAEAGTSATIRSLRSAGIVAPILALSADGLVSSRISALAEGADDCLSKPFNNFELSARLRAIVRRSRSLPHSVIKIGNVEIDLETREVRVSDRPIHLTATEYRMLELLALRKGRTVAKETIFASLYDGCDDPDQHVINVFVCKIRKKIAALNHGESYITTAWGGGYQMSERPPLMARAA